MELDSDKIPQNRNSKEIASSHHPARIPPQHFNLVEVWTLTRPLKHLDYFLLQAFCCRFVGMLGIIGLLHEPISAKL